MELHEVMSIFTGATTVISNSVNIWQRCREPKGSKKDASPKSRVPERRWKLALLTLLATIAFVISAAVWIYNLKKEVREAKEPRSTVKPLNESYEFDFAKGTIGASKLMENGKAAYDTGDYAYSAMFYNYLVTNNPTQTGWWANWPFYAMANLMQNPTSMGYSDFTNRLEILYSKITTDVKDGPASRIDNNRIEEIEDNIDKINDMIPPSEVQYKEYLGNLQKRFAKFRRERI